MKWRKGMRPPPALNRKRTVRRFAWVPVLVDEDDEQPMWAWLEFYYAYQEVRQTPYGGIEWYTIARYASDNPLLDNPTPSKTE